MCLIGDYKSLCVNSKLDGRIKDKAISFQRTSFSLTLYDDIGGGVDRVHVVGGEAGVLSSVGLPHVLNIQPAGGGDVDAGVVGEGAAVPFGPGHPGLRLTRGAALQGHALPNQHLCVLWLNHKTGPRWRSRGGGQRGRMGRGNRCWIS